MKPRKRAKLRGAKQLQRFMWGQFERGAAVMLPVLTVSEANSREHRMVSALRHKSQKQVTRAFMRDALGTGGVVYRTVKFTRYAPGTLDTDNLAGSMKYIRDEIARWMCVDDAPSSGVQWEYAQAPADAYGVFVELIK